MELSGFLYAGTNLWKFKDDWKYLGWTLSKVGMISLSMGVTVCEEWINGINWSFFMLVQIKKSFLSDWYLTISHLSAWGPPQLLLLFLLLFLLFLYSLYFQEATFKEASEEVLASRT